MNIKNQLIKLEKITLIMSIIHFIAGIFNILSYYGIIVGVGSIISSVFSFNMFLSIRKITVKNESFKDQLFYILKNLKYYFLGILIIIIGIIVTYFLYKNYLSNFLNNVIY